MRILFFSQHFWPESFGFNDLVLKLTNAGEIVSVLTGKPNYPDGQIFDGYSAWGTNREKFGKADVFRIPLIPRGSNSRLRLAVNYLSFIFSGFLLAPTLLRGKRFDVVLVYASSPLLQALPALLIAVLKRARLAVWVQDLWPATVAATGHIKNPLWLTLIGVIVRFIYRHTDLVLVQSEAFRAPVASMLDDPSKIHYLPNAVDVDSYGVAEHFRGMDELTTDIKGCFSVVFAGNLGNAQSLGTIVAAAAVLRECADIRFFVFGSGSQLEWLKGEIAHLKLENIVLPGRLPSNQMPPIFAISSVLLVTLGLELVYAYTIPSKLQAYLASGRPIIVCANGEAARVVNEAHAGLTCGAGNAVALSETILLMRDMPPAERLQLGENARAYAKEHFDLKQQAARLIAILESDGKKNGDGGGF